MTILLLFLIFVALEFFESTWQKSDTLYGLINNNFSIFNKNIILYFLLHTTFFYTIFLSFYLNNFTFWMSSILVIKFLDISFKLTLMQKLSSGKEINELIPMNINMNLVFRYMNLVIYPLTFLFAIGF
ncbi:putative membrane protein [Arcobacter acticola]|jgi:hypothetical protein|uniref:Putative membrane protein n=2 Tax=Arcobacter acticola TaxID=1849015 RepID=A0A6M8EJY0_9BACT|nr:hypothetical protein [Aliarcobacter sp.]QKE29616.1 putative membrane protein [Arcobacter acticola]